MLRHFRYAIVFDDGTFETHDILGTEESAREIFSQEWMSIHSGHGHLKTPVKMELVNMADDDDTILASYEIEVTNA
jgi:hypothetical protein